MRHPGNDPAFPDQLGTGMSLRAYIATAALQGILVSAPTATVFAPAEVSALAVKHADALLAELAKETPHA